MTNRKIILASVSVLFLMVFSFSFISAITGSIGNARMILNAEQGDVIEKTILVINVNDVAVNITISASGDLGNSIEIIDDNFILQPKEEKKARIKITVAEAGTTESSVNVQFAPIDGKNGVGLSSTIIINAKESNFWDFWGGDDSDDTDVTSLGGDASEVDKKGSALTIILIIVFIVLIIVLFIVLSSLFKKNKLQKRKDRSA